MDKTILFAGLALSALGGFFLIVRAIDSSLSDAFIVGGYLWLVLGGLTIGLAARVKREKNKRLGALRQ